MTQRIAVVGSGISGIVSAYLLDQKYEVTLIEAEPRLGGHTHTVEVPDPQGRRLAIDTGFIVFNEKNYPLFTRFLSQLGVAYNASDMSFGYHNEAKNFFYASHIPFGLFSQKKNLVSPTFLKFLKEIPRFNQYVSQDLARGFSPDLSLKAYLDKTPFSEFFKSHYILPMGAAIWSCSIRNILEFPAHSFFSFWQNHFLLTVGKRPQWQTITGGSHSYIHAFLKIFKGQVMTHSPVQSIERTPSSVTLHLANRPPLKVDKVVVATHADQALQLLNKPSKAEQSALSQWQYSKNDICLHTDPRVMPPKKSGWASWLVQKPQHTDELVMSYYMNSLQKLKTSTPYFVTLNATSTIPEAQRLKTMMATHPLYTKEALKSQAMLPNLNTGRVLFAGSYFGYGFHEDGVKSAVDMAKTLGISL